MYGNGNVDAPFGLATTFPKREIPLQGTLKDVGLTSDLVLRVEHGAIEFDPLVVFGDACKVAYAIYIFAITYHIHALLACFI